MTTTSPWHRRSEFYALSIAFIMLITFLGLTPLGRWQHDEFYTITLLREGGIMAMVNRALFWSPRPVSEIPLISYLYLTEWVGRPMIETVLSSVWAFMYGLVLWASLKAGDRKLFPLSLGVIALFMTIAGRNNSDALFWVQGAFAYAPSIAFALALAFFSVFKPSAIREFGWTYLLLAVGLAFSSESGAFLVFFHALLLPVYLLWRDNSFRPTPAARNRLLCVLGSAFVVICLIANARGSVVEQDQASNVDQIVSSVFRSMISVSFDFVFVGRNTVEGAMAYLGFLPKLCVFTAVVVAVARSDMSRRDGEVSLVWGAAALLGAFAVVFASYVKYDNPGALRQITVTNAFLWASLLGFAAWVGTAGRNWPLVRKASYDPVPGGALLLALLVPTALIVPSVAHDYGIFSERQETRDVLWQSRHQTVSIKLSPEGQFIGNEKLAEEPVAIQRDPDGDWADDSLLDYFGTERIEVLP